MNKKKVILSSLLTIGCCASLMGGATYALFTSSSETNIAITSGKVDVTATPVITAMSSLENIDTTTYVGTTVDRTDDGTFLTGGTASIDEDGVVTLSNIVPGDSVTLSITVVNKSTVAAKYRLIMQEATPTGKDETDSKLLFSGLSYTVTDTNASKSVLDGVTNMIYYRSGWEDLAASTSGGETVATYSVTIAMPADLGNDYQGLSTSVDFTLEAVQGNASVAEEETISYYAADDEALETLIANAQAGDVVSISGSYSLTSTIASGVTLAGSGADETTLTVPATTTSDSKTTGLVIENENVTIKDVTLVEPESITNDQYVATLKVNANDTVIEGVTIEKSYSTDGNKASGIVVGSGLSESGTLTISGCNLSGAFKTLHIVDGADGTINIDKTTISGIYTFNVNSGSSPNLVVNVTNSALHGWTSYGTIKECNFTNTVFSKGDSSYDHLKPQSKTTLTNCTFDANFTIGAGAACEIILVNCTYNGTKVTADNIKNFLDTEGKQDSDNKTYLPQCTIIVGGVTVSLS